MPSVSSSSSISVSYQQSHATNQIHLTAPTYLRKDRSWSWRPVQRRERRRRTLWWWRCSHPSHRYLHDDRSSSSDDSSDDDDICITLTFTFYQSSAPNSAYFTLNRFNIKRGRHVVNDSIEEGLDALVLEGGSWRRIGADKGKTSVEVWQTKWYRR